MAFSTFRSSTYDTVFFSIVPGQSFFGGSFYAARLKAPAAYPADSRTSSSSWSRLSTTKCGAHLSGTSRLIAPLSLHDLLLGALFNLMDLMPVDLLPAPRTEPGSSI